MDPQDVNGLIDSMIELPIDSDSRNHRYDCVWVTMARFANISRGDVERLTSVRKDHMVGMFPIQIPVTLAEVANGDYDEVQLYLYHFISKHASKGGSGRFRATRFGICYYTPSGNGHCVCLEPVQSNITLGKAKTKFVFIDYQGSKDGVDVSRVVASGKITAIFTMRLREVYNPFAARGPLKGWMTRPRPAAKGVGSGS